MNNMRKLFCITAFSYIRCGESHFISYLFRVNKHYRYTGIPAQSLLTPAENPVADLC